MSNIVKAALILSAGIVFGAFALGGVYTTTPAGDAYFVFLVNRWTGQATLCAANGCRPIGKESPPTPVPAPTPSANMDWGNEARLYTEPAK